MTELLQPVYVQDMWMGKTAWFTTAYFVDPLVICNGGRCLFGFLNHICHLDILNLVFINHHVVIDFLVKLIHINDKDDAQDVSGVQATGTTMEQETVF